MKCLYENYVNISSEWVGIYLSRPFRVEVIRPQLGYSMHFGTDSGTYIESGNPHQLKLMVFGSSYGK